MNPIHYVDPDGNAPISADQWSSSPMRYMSGPAEASTCSSISCNNRNYDAMDTSLAVSMYSRAIQSDWFAAASYVTGFPGIGAFEGLISGTATEIRFGMGGDYIRAVHYGLAKENYKTFNSLFSGEGLKGKEGLRGKALDYALVDKEQAMVTKATDEFFKGDESAKASVFSDMNASFDPENKIAFSTQGALVQKVIKDRFTSKGLKFDIGSENDRRQLGYGLVDEIRRQRTNYGDSLLFAQTLGTDPLDLWCRLLAGAVAASGQIF